MHIRELCHTKIVSLIAEMLTLNNKRTQPYQYAVYTGMLHN